MELDRVLWNQFAGAYKSFIRSCNIAEINKFPVFQVELSWDKADVKQPWLEQKPAEFHNAPTLSLGPPDDELCGDAYDEETERFRKAPWLDVQWFLDLEILPVNDDGTMSYQFRVPFEQAKSSTVAAESSSSADPGPSESTSAGGKMERLKAFKDGISRRIRGERHSEARRSLMDTLRRDPNNPDCVLLAACRWEGRAQDAFTVIGAKVTVGTYEIAGREPFQMHQRGPTAFVMDSSHAVHWEYPSDDYARNRRNIHGLKKRDKWLESYSIFPDRGAGSDVGTDVKLTLTIQMNENSIPTMGFPFDRLGLWSNERFQTVLESLRQPLEGSVHLRGIDNDDYYVPEEVLVESSEYFRTLLTDNWHHSEGAISFPQVPPFTSPRIIPEIMFFLVQRTVIPNLLEDCVDLMIAAEFLIMPDLMEMASIGMLSKIGLENVTETIRFAWERRAARPDLLLRAALLFLKSNYDQIWVDNKDDLADLGALLSHPNFLGAFQMTQGNG